jgi:hypothetical protein
MNGAWTPGTFTLQLAASGGQPCCFNSGFAQAQALAAQCVSTYMVASIDRAFVSACSLDGSAQVLAGKDNMVIDQPLPFYVTLYNTFLPSVGISSNGFLCFAGDNPFPTRQISLPWQNPNEAPQGAVFAYWDDLVLSSTGVCIATTGTAPREFVLTWENAQPADNPYNTVVSFSIILTEGSPDVVVVYGNFAMDGGPASPGLSATVGMQDRNASGYSTVGTLYRSSQTLDPAIWSNTAIKFTGVV